MSLIGSTGGWDSVTSMSDNGNLNDLKLHVSSAYAAGEQAFTTGQVGTPVKLVKFTLGCCYVSLMAFKITEIIPGTVGATDVITGYSTVVGEHGPQFAWVQDDKCGIVAGTTTTMKQTQIEAAVAKAVAEFRICLAKEILGGPTCSPAYDAEVSPPPSPPPSTDGRGGEPSPPAASTGGRGL
jgi:hypothetical protein